MNTPLLRLKIKFLFILLFFAFGIQAQNNECVNAILIDPQDDVDSDVQVVANFNGATLSTPSPACNFTFSSTAGDIWYTFTANATKYILDASEYMKAELYEGTDCNLSYMYCKNGLAYLDNLEVGTKYYLKLINNNVWQEESTSNQFLFRLVKAPDAPATDLCANAELLTGTAVSSNLTGANMEYPSLPLAISAESVLGDVWFKFTASENYATIVISPTSTGFGQNHALYASMYTGNCGALVPFQSLGQFDSFGNGASTDTNQLLIGETYYIRVYYYGVTENWPFTINMIPRPSPANDLCTNATTFALDADGETLLSVPSLTYATATTTITSTCASASTKDVWYKFTADAQNYLVTASSTTTVYSGTCGSLTQLNCGSGFVLGNLTIGQEYYIRAFSGQTITIREFEAADECASSVLLTPSINPMLVYSSTLNATQSSSATTCIASNKDVWFSFVATSTNHKFTVFNGYGTNANDAAAMSIYSGGCAALSQIGCYSFLNNSLEPIIDTFVVGQTYFIKITRGASTYFGIKVTQINTQANNEFANAIAVIPGSPGTCSYILGSTEAATPTAGLTATCSNTIGYKDVWYSFAATSDLYNITFVTTGWHNLSIYKEIAPGTIELFTCLTGNLFGFEIGSNYFIRVGKLVNTDSEPQGFQFCISSVTNTPANDDCANAIDISVALTVACGTSVTADLSNASHDVVDGFPSACIDGYENKDIWYRFTATASKILITNLGTLPYNDFKFVVFEDSCTNYNCLEQDFLGAGAPRFISGLTAGQTYLLLISYEESNAISFCLSSVPTIANDSCQTPITLTPSLGLSCDETIVSYRGIATPAQSLNVSGCAPGFNLYLDNPNPNLVDYNDVWYQFTATAEEHLLHFLGSGVTMVQLFSGTCDNLVCASSVYSNGGNGTPSALFSNLVVGNSYFIRVVEQQTDYLTSYQFCLKTLMPVPFNDEYANAIDLIPSGNLDTCNPVSNYFNRATFSNNVQAPSCINESTPNDVWFKFTATAVDHQLQIHLNNSAATLLSFETSLYTSSNGVVSQEIYCFDPVASVPDLDVTPAGINAFNFNYYFPLALQNYTGLTIGATYYVRIYPFVEQAYHYSIPMTYDICLKTLPEIPQNKDLANALSLAVSETSVLDYVSGYATRAAYHVTEPFNIDTNPCAELNAFAFPSNQASNVWYKFTATQTSHELHVVNDANILFPLSNYYPETYYTLYAALYENNNSIFENKKCYTDTATNIVFDDLEIGKEYYIKMMYQQIHYLTDFEFQLAVGTPVLSLHEAQFENIVIFPNPVREILHINADQRQIKSVEIYTILGQLALNAMSSGTEFTIDVSSLVSGTYLIKMQGENGNIHRKFIKE